MTMIINDHDINYLFGGTETLYEKQFTCLL
jgi:hypothetical protein